MTDPLYDVAVAALKRLSVDEMVKAMFEARDYAIACDEQCAAMSRQERDKERRRASGELPIMIGGDGLPIRVGSDGECPF